MKQFTPNAESVCEIQDGSNNDYLDRVRAVEDFLKSVEPKYNRAVAHLAAGSFDEEPIRTISGFIAYVISCSPAAMRLNEEPLRSQLEITAELLAAQGKLPPPPPELGFGTALEAIRAAKLSIDLKFPQAIGIANIQAMAARLAGFHWEILHNPFAHSPFFTSDYPVAMEPTSDPMLINKIVPLTPTLAVRIKPHLLATPGSTAADTFRGTSRIASKQEVIAINRLVVGCAEDLVFFRDNHPWVLAFVAKHRHLRVESVLDQIRTEHGTMTISRLALKARRPPAEC